MKTCKMNVKPIRGSYSPECTNCGALYVGCQVEGKDFNKLDFDLKDWISARSSSLRALYDRRVKDAKKLVKAAKEAK